MITHNQGALYFTRGDQQISFDDLYTEHWKMLCSIGYRIIPDREVIRDLVQNVFISFVQSYPEKEIGDVTKFLLQALRFQCFTWLRDNKVAQKNLTMMQLCMSENSTEQTTNVMFLSEQIEKLVSKMPNRPQQIFRLSRFENLTNDEIASRLDIDRKTVENHLTHALRILRLSLKTILLLAFSLL